ncbi:MAG: hypothetical protein EXS31_15320 [Pedosphaera sp.]|nr:hypothetical protein [Pedosphaera sp.]
MTRRLTIPLAVRMGLAVVLVQAVVLIALGLIYTKRFAAEVDRRLEEGLERPGALITQGSLQPSAVAEANTMRQLAGDAVVEALAVGMDGNVFHGLNTPSGSDFKTLPGVGQSWLEQARNAPVTIRTTDHTNTFLIRLSPVITAAGQAPLLVVFVKLRTTEAEKEKALLARRFLLGALGAIAATSVVLVAIMRLLVTARVSHLADAVRQVGAGDYSVRIGASRVHDEIGVL